MSRARSVIAKAFIAGESDAMKAVISSMEDAAKEVGPVLILGERGTGRELVARVIHFASARHTGPFLSIKAPGAPTPILQDNRALAMAQGGTLLIKNVAALPRGAQRTLARMARAASAQKSGEDVRIMAASDPELEVVVDAELFNRDLYNTLRSVRIELPPLREREADIPKLADHFVRVYGREVGRRSKLSSRAYDRLVAYPWPGNVGELKDVARRLVLRTAGPRIESGDVNQMLPLLAERVPYEEMSFEEMVAAKLGAFLRRVEGYAITGFYEDVIARVERPLLRLVMDHTGGNQVKAAEILGMNRNTLRRKLAEHGIRARTLRARSLKRKTIKKRSER